MARNVVRLGAAMVGLVAAASACSGSGGSARPVSAPASATATGTAAAKTWWKPKARLTWQWQLSGKVNTSVKAQVYDVDLFETSAATVATLHKAGRKVICYTAIGSAETWRPDFKEFPRSALGKKVQGWEDERWVDIRRIEVVRKIWGARLDQCKKKGFDGVEPDWMDGYKHDTGFKLTAKQQLAFNRMLAHEAHRRGLAIGLKNDLDQIPQLVNVMDFAVNEECAQFRECHRLTPFIKANKPVFHAEYELPLKKFCAQSKKLGLSSIRKHVDLPAARQAC
ncbi:endo alpha-1,4 polygalactosaminidase [Spirillospora sp. NPDC048911]|uniref:endo alpha-1,4 polygalactosaminidase n=1 Tax=Spirillospora sp. NPDC048911 TaxID=3364527 RepID=UPI00371CFC3E